MRFLRNNDEPVTVPLTSMFDVVMLLIIFFIVSVATLGGIGDAPGVKSFVVPSEAGDADCSLLVQLTYQGNVPETLILSASPGQVGRVQALKAAAGNGGLTGPQIRSLCRSYGIPLLPVSNMTTVQGAINNVVAQYARSKSARVELAVVLRAESDVPYHYVLQMLDCLDAEYVRSRADVNSVLLVGPLVRSAGQKGLLECVDIVTLPAPPLPPCRQTAAVLPRHFKKT